MKQVMTGEIIPRKPMSTAVQSYAEDFGDTPATHLLLSSANLSELSTLLGANITTPADLIRAARNVTTLSVDGVDITLDSYLLNRLKSRCHPTQEFPEFLRDRVKELLAGYAGC